MKSIEGYHIATAYFKTKKHHTNRPDEINILNVDIKKNEGNYRDNVTEIFLDNTYLATIPISKESGIYKEDNNQYTIRFHIDKPENIGLVPFRYEMKLYPLFGRDFEISNGKTSNQRYRNS